MTRTRTIAEMNEVERAQHRTYMERLASANSTKEEQADARLKLDALEWKGVSGPVMERITALENRIAGLAPGDGTQNEVLAGLVGQVDSLRRDFAALAADAIEEAKTAIHAEAVAAATQAVADLLGDPAAPELANPIETTPPPTISGDVDF